MAQFMVLAIPVLIQAVTKDLREFKLLIGRLVLALFLGTLTALMLVFFIMCSGIPISGNRKY